MQHVEILRSARSVCVCVCVCVFCEDLRINSDFFPLCSINCLFVTETECVYFAVRTEFLNILEVKI